MLGRPPKWFRDFPEWYLERPPLLTKYGEFRPLTVFDQRALIGNWAKEHGGQCPFYVYMLIDVQRVEPFYVGVAETVRRPSEHLRDAWNGKKSESAQRIREIETSGHSVKFDIVEIAHMGGECVETEKWICAQLGREAGGPLLNVGPGGEGPWNREDLYI